MLSNVYQFQYYSHEKLYPITVLQWTCSFSASDILFHGNTYFLSNCTRRSYMHVFALVIFPYKANFVSSCPSQKRCQPFRTKAYCIKIWLFKALTNFMALLQWYFLVIVIIEPKILRYLMTCNTLMPGYISFLRLWSFS